MKKSKKHSTKQGKLALGAQLAFIILILSVIGLFFVFEASTAESYARYSHQYFYVYRQLRWFGLGMGAFLLAKLLPLNWWRKFSPFLFIGGLVSLLLVFIPSIGVEVNGAKRWINLAGFSIQPVEFFKVGLVLFFAHWLSSHQRLLPFLFLSSIPVVILLFQPDFGSMLVLLTVAAGMFFNAGGSVKKVAPFVALGLAVLVLAIIISPYRLRRIKTFLNPELDPLGASFQIRQITLALGSGGWFGQGLGNSQQKHSFIPEASSDSIFAIIAEEVGFVGALVIISLFYYLFVLIYRLAGKYQTNSYQQLVIIGILIWMAGQTLLNLAAVVALVPLTGLPLPFFSYGGSSLVTLLLMSGILVRLASATEIERGAKCV